MIKERPILFSAPMVRAILEGRKTQTRRIMKPQPPSDTGWFVEHEICGRNTSYREFEGLKHTGMGEGHVCSIKCPYGKPGDRLWVRESFNTDFTDGVLYAADGGSAKASGYAKEPRWKPSIHMPRWASRILLEITSVRVERLQDISEADALAEGIIKLPASGRYVLAQGDQYFGMYWSSAKAAFSELWQHINGPESWATNPWVRVVEFKLVESK